MNNNNNGNDNNNFYSNSQEKFYETYKTQVGGSDRVQAELERDRLNTQKKLNQEARNRQKKLDRQAESKRKPTPEPSPRTPSSSSNNSGDLGGIATVAIGAVIIASFFSGGDNTPKQEDTTTYTPPESKSSTPEPKSSTPKPKLSAEQLALNTKFPALALVMNKYGADFPAREVHLGTANYNALKDCNETTSGCYLEAKTEAGTKSCMSYVTTVDDRLNVKFKSVEKGDKPLVGLVRDQCFTEFRRVTDLSNGREPFDRLQCEAVEAVCNYDIPNYNREAEYTKYYYEKKAKAATSVDNEILKEEVVKKPDAPVALADIQTAITFSTSDAPTSIAVSRNASNEFFPARGNSLDAAISNSKILCENSSSPCAEQTLSFAQDFEACIFYGYTKGDASSAKVSNKDLFKDMISHCPTDNQNCVYQSAICTYNPFK